MPVTSTPIWKRPDIITHTQCMLDSYRHWLGRDLLPRTGSPEDQSRAAYDAPIAILSDGLEASPVFNYANATVLRLFETDWDHFTTMVSRNSAEVVHQAERERLRDQVTQKGFIDNYRGIRISTRGKRFWIEQAVVWVVRDNAEKILGKAATFAGWTDV